MGQLACKLDQKYYDANVKYYELIRKKAKKLYDRYNVEFMMTKQN